MDLSSIFINDTTWSFAAEIVIRVTVMFFMIITFLRFTGKRGIRQLSIFELTIILSLGSIAGDPMFTEDLPLVQAVLIMSLIIGLYRLCTWLAMKFQPVEYFLEGKSLYIVEDGILVLEKIEEGKMSHDEFFAEMRQQNIEHLGQVRVGLLETDGEFSMLLFAPEKVQYGLPIFPKSYQAVTHVHASDCYACMYCGQTAHITKPNKPCLRCNRKHWALAINSPVVR